MMNTGLNFVQRFAASTTEPAFANSHSNAATDKKTWAELSHRVRLAIVDSWQDEKNDNSNFYGNVTFNKNKQPTHNQCFDHAIKVCENSCWQLAVSEEKKVSNFSTVLLSKKAIFSLAALSKDEINNLANILAMISTRYDNLMMASVGLSIQWFVDEDETRDLFAVISPIIGSEPGMFGAQRFMFSDFTPAQAARRLCNLSDIHFRDVF